MSDPRDLLLERGLRLVREAADFGVSCRLAGSAAVAHRCEAVARQWRVALPIPRDLDCIALRQHAGMVREYLARADYRQDPRILIATEGRRWTLRAGDGSHNLDVFFDALEFTHRLDLRDRVMVDADTIPVGDLLLAKLQYVSPDARDLSAMVLCLAGFSLEDHDGDALNRSRVAAVLSESWGYYRTATENLRRASAAAPAIFGGSEAPIRQVRERVDALLGAIEAHPKPLAWRLRGTIGSRIKWYNDVEKGEVF